MTHETHSACQEEMDKHAGNTPCCRCTGHSCVVTEEFVDCECCEEDPNLLKSADISGDLGGSLASPHYCPDRTFINGKNVVEIYCDYLKLKESYDKAYEAGRQSVFEAIDALRVKST